MDEKFRNLDFDPRNLPKEHQQAIGLACACYAQTEDHVKMAVSGLLGIDMERGWAVTTHMTAPLRESVIKSLSDIHFLDLADIEKLDEILKEVSEAAVKRNEIAHNLWATDEQTREVFIIKTSARTHVSVDQKPVSLDAIRKDAEFIYAAGMKLFSFLISKNLVPRLPPRNRSRVNKRQAIKQNRRRKSL